jgi:hypothetical protein
MASLVGRKRPRAADSHAPRDTADEDVRRATQDSGGGAGDGGADEVDDIVWSGPASGHATGPAGSALRLKTALRAAADYFYGLAPLPGASLSHAGAALPHTAATAERPRRRSGGGAAWRPSAPPSAARPARRGSGAGGVAWTPGDGGDGDAGGGSGAEDGHGDAKGRQRGGKEGGGGGGPQPRNQWGLWGVSYRGRRTQPWVVSASVKGGKGGGGGELV